MNLLLTGANGFIGSYFIKKYHKSFKIKTFSFFKDDFHQLTCQNIDTIVHLSALVHQMKGALDEEYERVNVKQTIELAQKVKEAGVKHFIFMSTIKVYGEETNSIYNELSKCNPKDSYGKSKLKAEQELLKLQSQDFKVSIIRTPIVYGYGVKANIKSLVNLVNKISIIPLGKISNNRTMVYIGNLCHLINEIIIQNKEGIYLAADDISLSSSELIHKIAKELNKKVFLIYIPLFPYSIKKLKPSFYKRLFCSLEIDNTITKKKLSLSNPYSNDEGIRYMINGENV